MELKKVDLWCYKIVSCLSVGGVMVSIDAFQALDPGSIPGHRTSFSLNFGDDWRLDKCLKMVQNGGEHKS